MSPNFLFHHVCVCVLVSSSPSNALIKSRKIGFQNRSVKFESKEKNKIKKLFFVLHPS